ncbi:MAG: phage tail protein [Moraxella sp.]|nr:phage tail protein [Moraxella sp.]
MITSIGDIQLTDSRLLQSVNARFGCTYATHELAVGKPIKQSIGATLTEWRLTVRLHYQFCDPATVLAQLQTILNNGKPVPLVFDYLDYVGYVTLDDVDVAFMEVATSGRPLIIDGNLTLSEFSGDTTIKPPAPAVQSQTAQNTPIATAQTPDINTLLPTEQPLQSLERALIAQMQARALVRQVKEVGSGDFTKINDLTQTASLLFGELKKSAIIGTLPPTTVAVNQGNVGAVLDTLNGGKSVLAELAKQRILRKLAT